MAKNRIEPPILLSRLMTFVLATAVVVLVVMGITLYKMFPLNRPQVFFLDTKMGHELDITVRDLSTTPENLENYKGAFIREYIKARNEITSDITNMRQKWSNNVSAPVRAWSSESVYNNFIQTRMWTAMMYGVPDFEISCPINFDSGAISRRGQNPQTKADIYTVKFRQFCENSDGQLPAKDYTITLELKQELGTTKKWIDRLTNPLGIKVVKYTIESVDGDKSDKTDPLNNFG